MANLIIPIIEIIDIETRSVVALASDETKAQAMVKALNSTKPGTSYYYDNPLPVDTIAF
jgi:hypothetical protein